MSIARSSCIVLLSVLAAATPLVAHAQLTQCQGVTGNPNYKVLVDEVQYATATGAAPALPIELLQSSVEGALEKVRRGVLRGATSSPGGVTYLNCAGRHPSGEAAFDPTIVRCMATNHAILELWGTLFPEGDGVHTFDVHYMMFPVALSAPARSGSASTTMTMAAKPTIAQIKRYLVSTRADLPAYFAVSAGVQAYEDRQWNQALRFLCEARTRLKGKSNQQDLMSFADDLASKAAAELRKGTSSPVSLLSDKQASDYCSFATQR